MSNLLTFIGLVIEFLVKLIVTLFCIVLAALSFLDIWRWPEVFIDYGDCDKLTTFWGVAVSSFFTMLMDMVVFTPCTVLTTFSWRGPQSWYRASNHLCDAKKEGPIHIGLKLRSKLLHGFALLIADIFTLPTMLAGLLMFWRWPFYIPQYVKYAFQDDREHSHRWRPLGIFHFFIGIADMFVVFMSLIGTLCSPYRAFTMTFPEAWKTYQKGVNSTYYDWFDPMVTGWRTMLVAGAAMSIADFVSFLGALFCLLFPWRWRWMYLATKQFRPRAKPGETQDPVVIKKRHEVDWHFVALGNVFLGICDVFTAVPFVFLFCTWRNFTMRRCIKQRLEEWDGHPTQFQYGRWTRFAVWLHLCKFLIDIPVLFMAAFTIGTLFRAWSLIRRMRLIATNSKEHGHHKESWLFCDYRRPIFTEFGKALICVLLAPLFFLLIITGYRLPVLYKEIQKGKEELARREAERQAAMERAAPAAAAVTSESEMGDGEPSSDYSRAPDASNHEEPAAAAAAPAADATSAGGRRSRFARLQDAVNQRKADDERFFGFLFLLATQCGLIFLDLIAGICGLFALLMLIRFRRIWNKLFHPPFEQREEPGQYRRTAMMMGLVLSFRDWLCLLLSILTLLSPARTFLLIRDVVRSCRRAADPEPQVLVTEVRPKFIHGVGWQLAVKGRKESDLYVQDAEINFLGERFWDSFAKKIGSAVRMIASTQLPFQLVPKYLDIEKINNGEPEFDLLIDLRANVKRRTIIKKLKLLDQHAPVEIVVTCNNGANTLFALVTTTKELLETEEAETNLPLTGLRTGPKTMYLTWQVPRTTAMLPADAPRDPVDEGDMYMREFSSITPEGPSPTKSQSSGQSRGYGSAAATSSGNEPVPERTSSLDNISAEDAEKKERATYKDSEYYGPYACTNFWHLALLAVGQTFLDWFAIFCYMFTVIVPFRWYKLTKQIYQTAGSYQRERASEYLATYMKLQERFAGKGHLDLVRNQQRFMAEFSKSASELGPGLNNTHKSKQFQYYTDEIQDLAAQLEQVSTGHSQGAEEAMNAYLHNMLVLVMCNGICDLRRREALVGTHTDTHRPQNGIARLVGGVLSRMGLMGGDSSGDRGSRRYRSTRRTAAPMRRSRRFGGVTAVTREDHINASESDDDYPKWGLSDHPSAETISRRGRSVAPSEAFAMTYSDEIGQLRKGIQNDAIKNCLLDPVFFAEVATSGAPVDEMAFVNAQKSLSDIMSNQIYPALRKVEGFVCCEDGGRDWNEVRMLCYHHALMVFPDLIVLIGVLIIIATVYRAYTLFRSMYRDRHWRWYLPWIFGEILLDIIFLLMFAFVICTIRYSVEMVGYLIYVIVKRWSFWSCREVIFVYFIAVFEDLFHVLKAAISGRFFRYIIAVALCGMVAPAELISNKFDRGPCGCPLWPFVLFGTMLYYAFPFIVVYADDSSYLTLMFVYGALMALAVLFATILVLKIDERTNESGDSAGAEIEIESVSLSHTPLSSQTLLAFFIIAFEGYQLASLAISKHVGWGEDMAWLTDAARYATLTNVSVGDEQYPIGFYLSLAFAFLYFLVISFPLVVNDILHKTHIDIAGRREWIVATYILGPILALSIVTNLVGFSVCTDETTLTTNTSFSNTSATFAPPVPTLANETNITTPSPTYPTYFADVNRTVRYMTVGSDPSQTLCWINNDDKGFGVMALVLLVFYIPTAVLKGTRWPEPIDGADVRFHEGYNSLALIMHIVLAGLSAFMWEHATAYCILQMIFTLVAVILGFRNERGPLPYKRNCTSDVANQWRTGAHLVGFVAALITLIAVNVDPESDMAKEGSYGTVVIGAICFVGLITVIRALWAKWQGTPDVDGSLTQLLDDIRAYESAMVDAGMLVGWRKRDARRYRRSLNRAATSKDISGLLLRIEKRLPLTAYKRLFFMVRNQWRGDVGQMEHWALDLKTLQSFEEKFQALKNGTSATPVELDDVRNMQDDDDDIEDGQREREGGSGVGGIAGAMRSIGAAIVEGFSADPHGSRTPPPATNPAWAGGGDANDGWGDRRPDYRGRLIAFFKFYDPSRIDQVDTILAENRGEEETVISALTAVYGPEPERQDSWGDGW